MSETSWEEQRQPCHLSCVQTSPTPTHTHTPHPSCCPGSFPPPEAVGDVHIEDPKAAHTPAHPQEQASATPLMENGTLYRGQGEVSMRTPTHRCLLMPQPFSPVPIPYSHPISGFGNQVRSADGATASLGFPPEGWLGTEGSLRECGASRFYSGRDAKAEHSCRNRGFPHEHAAVPLPLPLDERCGESGERLHIPLLHPKTPYLGERHQPPHHSHNPKLSGLGLCEHWCQDH